MDQRVRFVAGLVATLVMALSLVETTWASMCAPVDGLGPIAAATTERVPPSGDCLPHRHDPDGDGERHCPFGPASATQACGVTASLPAHVTVNLAASPESAVLTFRFDTEPELLVASVPFRPPKS